MKMPYTDSPLDAYVAAQASVAAVLTAVIWARPLPTRLASALLVTAIWLATLLPVEPDIAKMILRADLDPKHAMHLLGASAALGSLAMIFSGRPALASIALIGELILFKICGKIEGSDWELAGLHLAWLGALIGLGQLYDRKPFNTSPLTHPASRPSYRREDVVLFTLAVILASIVAVVVLDRSMDSDDEWAYTYQADLFGHLRAYAEPPPCGNAFKMYWVWFYLGRAFCQYTPGWPLFMAPFVLLGIPWFAAPVSHGLMTVAVARLARRITTANGESGRAILFAGRLAAISAATGAATLLNAGSRFPHVFVAACFAWSIESVSVIAAPGVTRRAQWIWGLVLGASVSLCAASRPGDGVTLGFGVFLFFLYAFVRGRIGWRAFSGTAITFTAIVGLCLVILRLQLGVWFKTGYDIVEQFHPWAVPKYSLPSPGDVKYGIPLATASYSFWPCAPAFVFTGLISVRKKGRSVVLMLLSGSFVLALFLSYLEFGRGWDFGYGPRFHLPHVVTMAVGAGVLLGPLVANGVSRFGARATFASAGPAAIVMAAMLVGVVRIAPLIYPYAYNGVRLRNAVVRAIAKSKIRDAIVTVESGAVYAGSEDLPQNLPSRPNASVLIATPYTPEEKECLRRHYPNRTFYAASGRDTVVTLTPY